MFGFSTPALDARHWNTIARRTKSMKRHACMIKAAFTMFSPTARWSEGRLALAILDAPLPTKISQMPSAARKVVKTRPG